jgi:predicted HTH transcriptional regulator
MFDSLEELSRKIQLGEDSSLQLKAVFFRGTNVLDPHPNSLADELAAFANTRDGVLVLGVDDKTRNVSGIAPDKLDAVELYVRNLCNDLVQPPLQVAIFRLEIPNSDGTMTPVIKIEIPRSLFVHQSPGGYLYRLGSSKRPMPPEYLARLFQQRSQARIIRFEEQAVPNTSMASLSQTLWDRFATRSAEPAEVVLLKRKLLTHDAEEKVRASVAGILMCSDNPEKTLAWAYIEAVRYRGVLQDSNYQLDALRITGPLDEQIRQAMLFLRRNQVVAATKQTHRIEQPQFSERAVFEAVVNAVAHRDYSIYGSKIRFFLFDDRLELYSPGPLPNTVTVDSLPLRQSTRNELITSLLAECPVPEAAGSVKRAFYMEKRGDGVPIILRESEELSGRRPEYRLIDESELLLTIFASKAGHGLP